MARVAGGRGGDIRGRQLIEGRLLFEEILYGNASEHCTSTDASLLFT